MTTRLPCPTIRSVRRSVAALAAVALVAGACSGGDAAEVAGSDASVADAAPTTVAATTVPAGVPDVLIEGGRVTDATLDAAFDGTTINAPVLDAFVAEVLSLPEADRLAVGAELSHRVELEAARLSGLEDALGGAAATDAALTGAWASVNAAIDDVPSEVAAATPPAPVPSTGQPSGFAGPSARGSVSAPAPNGMAALGIMMGMFAVAVTAEAVVSSANDFTADQYSEGTFGSGAVVSGAIEQSTLEMTFDGTQDGVAVVFNTTVVVHPCPDPSGNFDIEAKIDVKTSKGNVGSNATIDMKIDGQVDDDAHLAGSTVEANTQWADFAGGQGQFLDFTTTGNSAGEHTFTANRSGGALTADFGRMAGLLSAMFVYMVQDKLIAAAEKAWSSGRCVQLNVTPSAGPDGLDPGQVVSVLAEPRSKVDGSPTGGNVTATLTAGVQSVEPNGSPVPADADSTYTAGSEQDETGTVAYESRSKRGVGKAQVTFKTGGAAAYLVVGGLEDWQVSTVVCDVTEPFTLESPGVGVAEFSGGLSGTYSATGVFNFSYAGTYQITLSNGLGSPGSMVATSGGQIAGQGGSGSENYSLTPAEPCA